MGSFADQLLVLVMLINFLTLGSNRTGMAIRAVAIQGVTLGLLPGLIHSLTWHLAVIIIGIMIAKGFIIPWLLTNAMIKVDIREDVEPYIGHLAALLAGVLCTVGAFVFSEKLPLAPEHQGLLIIPAAIATLLTGFLVLTTRRKAINQVIGYLIIDNGIFIVGLLLTKAMPYLVEAGVLLDLLVGIFVMGIIINHISREFSSIDTSRLSALKE